MDLRVQGYVESVETSTGYIPKYKGLQFLFTQVLNKDYKLKEYVQQFTMRIPENISKIDRMTPIYKERVLDTPPIVFAELHKQKQRFQNAQHRYEDYISPQQFLHNGIY